MSSHAYLRAKISALELEIQKMQVERQKMQTVKDEQHLLANGEYFAQLRDVLDTDKVDFTGGFRAICGRIDGGKTNPWRKGRFPSYKSLELELSAKVANAKVTDDDMSYASLSVSSREHISQRGGQGKLSKEEKAEIENTQKNWKIRAVNSLSSGTGRTSEDSSVNSGTGVKIVDTGVATSTGHLIAGNDSCSPTMGIFVQAIIGKDFEATMDSQIRILLKNQGLSDDEKYNQCAALTAKKKKILQNLAYGFCNLENNVVQVPKGGHEKFFDEDCAWITVPIMPLHEIIDWHYGKGGYWVMFIAGSFEKSDTAAYINFIQASRSAKEGEHVYIAGQREKCTRAEADEGIRNLTAFIKAFADLATGRGEKKMTPFDLVADNTRKILPNLPALRAAAAHLEVDGKVTVPILRDFEEQDFQILKVFIGHHDLSVLPEPMAVAAKGCLNVMALTGERATPCCGEASIITNDSDASFSEQSSSSIITNDSDASYIEQSSSVTPTKKSDIPEFVCVVTP